MRLYLVRHGQSTGNLAGTLTGQSDHGLTGRGVAQARATAAYLAPFGPMAVYSSDLPRAAATAEHIVRAWSARPLRAGPFNAVRGPRPRLLCDPRLREIDLGDCDGRSWEEFEADAELRAAFSADPCGTALPSGESVAELGSRVRAAVADILAAHGFADSGGLTGSGHHGGGGAAGDRAAGSHREDEVCGAESAAVAVPAPSVAAACVVSHDGPIRALINHYLGVPPEKWWTLTTAHGGVSMLEYVDGHVHVRFVNATGHLARHATDCTVPSYG